MKRFTAILLTGMMIFTLASCGKKAQDTPTEPATETQAAEKVEMPTETEAVTEVVTEAVKETQLVRYLRYFIRKKPKQCIR